MSDFFREVDEELRNDRMKAIWRNYGKYIIGFVVLVIVGTGAYRFYVGYAESQSGASGDRYLSGLELIENGDRPGAKVIFDTLEKDGWGAYPYLAKFRAASSLLGDGKTAEAISAFDALIAESKVPVELRDYAQLQAAMAAVDIESFDAIMKRTEPLIKNDNTWSHFAKEARALSAWKSGNLKETAKWVQDLKITSDIPEGLRQRLLILEDLIVSRGGTLPVAGSAS